MDYLFEFKDADIKQKKIEAKTSRKASLYRALDTRNTFKVSIGNSKIIPGKGVVLQGPVFSGAVKKGDLIRFNGQLGRIESIERFGSPIDVAGHPWTNSSTPVTILISGIENEVIYSGDQVIDIIKQNNSVNSEAVTSQNTQVFTTNYSTDNDNFLYEISDVFSITGRGLVLVGRILEGTISVGDKIKVDGKEGTVSAIEKFRRLVDNASTSDGDIGLLIREFKRGDATIGSVVVKENNRRSRNLSQINTVAQSTVNHIPQSNVSSENSAKATFVRIKPRVPISVKDLPTRNQNKLMNAITKYYNTLDNKDGIQHDGLGDISRLETDFRIYSINGDEATYGLVLYIDMKDNTWRRTFRDIVEAYRFRYSGQQEPAVITVINSSPTDDQELREIEEVEIRDSLISCGIKGDDYPVIFCDVDRINSSNITNKYDDAYAPVVELLREIDAYFETPERK